MRCLACTIDLEQVDEPTWLSKGTGYCGGCARRRVDMAFKVKKARDWLLRWKGQMHSAEWLTFNQEGQHSFRHYVSTKAYR